ncbi:MAG: SH3 domain-containing protein [Hydrotalea sp.]|nr:SH3 domain-containing protein [Hydrotalea sp.]
MMTKFISYVLLAGLMVLPLGLSFFPSSIAQAGNKAMVKDDLPKMVSTRWDKLNVRKGPGKEFPIVFYLQAKGIPLKLTRRHGDWREVRDWQGSSGWVLRDAISDDKTLIVNVDETDLTAGPNGSTSGKSRLIAKLKRGVTAKIIKCQPQWCQVQTFIGGRTGWLRVLDTKKDF